MTEHVPHPTHIVLTRGRGLLLHAYGFIGGSRAAKAVTAAYVHLRSPGNRLL